MGECTLFMQDDYQTGQPIVLLRYGNFYDLASNAYKGRMMPVGSDLLFIAREGAYVRARNSYGEEGLLLQTSITENDPRHWFHSMQPALSGFLVDGMYDDFSGGSLETATVQNVPALGEIVLDARFIQRITVTSGTTPHLIALRDGTQHQGKAPRLWLITATMRLNLSKATALTLERSK